MSPHAMSNAFGVIVFGVIFLLAGVIWWKILSKAGHRGWVGLLMLVPLVNVGLLLYLAFAEWPIHRELTRLRDQAGGAPQ